MIRLLKWLPILITVLIGITFACLNAERVSFHYYVGVIQLPLAVLLVAAVIVGYLGGYVSSLIKIMQLKFENRHLQQHQKHQIISPKDIP